MSRYAVLLAGSALAGVCLLTSAAPASAQGRGGQPVQLPDGPGREMVQARCGACHGLNQITGSAGFTREGWADLVGSMVSLSEGELATVSQYLASHYPVKPERRPKLVPGETKITFREWVAPTLGQRTRDPLQTPDGMIWWTGMYGSIVGRLDPRTGEMKEYTLPNNTRPHGIVADPAGNIWYTGNNNGTVGKIDAKTGEITVHPMPVAAARDPHTAIFDKAGTMFFTLQGSNMVGRLKPSNGEVTVVEVPTPNGRPYGIKVDSQGTAWFGYNGSNRIGRIDPVTLEVREFALPDAEARARRVALDSNDVIWYTDPGRGYIGKFDPKTGEHKSWPSPSGPSSSPYAIAVVDDVVWYNESGMRPDTLVRFDPKTEKFQSWPIPSGVGIIRHMTVSPDGNLVYAQSSNNRFGLVMIEK